MSGKRRKLGDGKLRTLRLRRMRRITAGLVHHRAPVWSSSARHIASHLGEGHDSCWVVSDRKGRTARVLEGPVDGTASFAPDGSLAYGRQVGATSEIWIVPSGGASPRRLLGGDGRLYRDPAFSPDGRLLCYAADDGPASRHEPSLKLWILDLARDEARVLVEGVTGTGAQGNPARLAHPAWSQTGDMVYFEAIRGDRSQIYRVPVPASGAPGFGSLAVPERLTDPGYRRPAPLAPGLLLCEQASDDPDTSGESALVLLDHRERERGRQRQDRQGRQDRAAGDERAPQISPLIGMCARDPAVVWRKKEVLVVWAMPSRAAPDEPSRYDLHVAELEGLSELGVGSFRRGKRPPLPEIPSDSAENSAAGPNAEPDPATDKVTDKATAAVTDLVAGVPRRAPDEASVWFDRPLFSDGFDVSDLYDEEPAAP